MAPGGVPIFDVVVDQGEVVEDLQGCGGGQGVLGLAAYFPTGQQAEERANALAGGEVAGTELFIQPAHMVVHHAVVAG